MVIDKRPVINITDVDVWKSWKNLEITKGNHVAFVLLATTWAKIMESKMNGKTSFLMIATESYIEAAKRLRFIKITKPIFCDAVHALIECWVYGPYLRIWMLCVCHKCIHKSLRPLKSQ